MPSMIRAFTGALKDKPDDRDYHLDLSTPSVLVDQLPNKFNMYEDKITVEQTHGSMGEVDSPFKLHVYDQYDGTSTCVCCAAGIAYKCLTERQKPADAGFIPSRLFLYYVYRLMLYPDLKHGLPSNKPVSEWLAALATDSPHVEEQITEDCGSSPRDVCKILKYLGCCEEKSMFESGAGYPTQEMEEGWKEGTRGPVGGKPWWPYFEIGPIPSGRNLEGYFQDYWWPAFNAFSVEANKEVTDGYIARFPSRSLGTRVPSSTAFANANKHKVLGFSHPGVKDSADTTADWKIAIKHGWPVIFMFYSSASTYYQDFEAFERSGWIASESNTHKSDHSMIHCVLAVGWNDQKKCFKIQDSYGTKWCDKGFWWMPYSWLEDENDTSIIVHKNIWVLHE